MRITTLGCYGRFAPPNKATSGYIVQDNNAKIVVDFGSGCMSRLLAKTDIISVDAIVLTHLHYDHMSDIFTLGYYLQYYKLRMKVFCPSSPKEIFDSVSQFSCFDIVIIENNSVINIGNLNIIAVSAPHPVETYSLIISSNDKTLIYTSDITSTVNIDKYLPSAQAVIGDACVLEQDRTAQSPHISVKTLALAMPSSARLYLAHLPYGLEKEVLFEAQTYNSMATLMADELVL